MWGKSGVWGKGAGKWGGGKWGGKGYWGGKGFWGVQQTQFNKKGKGGGGGGPKEIPADFTVNETRRFQGTCETYWKFKGYGFIVLKDQGVVPDNKVFVYWTEIQSEDRFPQLHQGMEVELNVSIKTDPKTGKRSIAAKNVSLPGGQLVEIQDSIDAEKKTFIGGQELRYTGKLKFYKPSEGYGYITMDDGYAVDSSVPKELRCEMAEMNAGGGNRPGNMKEVTEVEFGIWKNNKGIHKAYNVSLPGGLPLPAWEQRQDGAAGAQ